MATKEKKVTKKVTKAKSESSKSKTVKSTTKALTSKKSTKKIGYELHKVKLTGTGDVFYFVKCKDSKSNLAWYQLSSKSSYHKFTVSEGVESISICTSVDLIPEENHIKKRTECWIGDVPFDGEKMVPVSEKFLDKIRLDRRINFKKVIDRITINWLDSKF